MTGTVQFEHRKWSRKKGTRSERDAADKSFFPYRDATVAEWQVMLTQDHVVVRLLNGSFIKVPMGDIATGKEPTTGASQTQVMARQRKDTHNHRRRLIQRL